MLLCDRCYDSYHMECLDTPLDRMPVGVWFCAFCSLSNSILGVSD
jgi:histone demethylase JARID1